MFLEVKFLPSQRLGDRKLSSLMVTLQGEGSQMLKKESCNLEKEALIFFFFFFLHPKEAEIEFSITHF